MVDGDTKAPSYMEPVYSTIGAGGLAAGGVLLAAGLATRYALRRKKTTPSLNKLRQQISLPKNIPLRDRNKEVPVSEQISPHSYSGKGGKNYIYMAGERRPEIAAHEYGHIKNMEDAGKLKKPLYALRALLGAAGVVGGWAATRFTRPGSAWRYAAPLMIIGGTAPLLLEEGLASVRGAKHMSDKGKPLTIKQKALLAGAWSTYAALPVLLASASLLSRNLPRSGDVVDEQLRVANRNPETLAKSLNVNKE